MVLVSYNSNFRYTSVLASDFDIAPIPLTITTNLDDTNFVIQDTEAVDDLSGFSAGQDVILSQVANLIPYSGELDGSITFRGINYNNIYNPIMLTTQGTVNRYVVFTAQETATGEQKRFMYREQFGTSPVTPRLYEVQEDNLEALTPAVQSVSNSTSSQRFYWLTGNGNDPEYQYARHTVNENQVDTTEYANAGSGTPNYAVGNVGARIISFADESYAVTGAGTNQFTVVSIDHSGNNANYDLTRQVVHGVANGALASTRVGNGIYIIAGNSLYELPARPSNPGGELNDVAPTLLATYSGYYFTRAFFDDTSNQLFLVGDTTATTGQLPASFSTQKVYVTDNTLGTITELGTIDIGFRTNPDVVRLPNSQLYMIAGASANVLVDASTTELLDASTRIQDNQSLLVPTNQIMSVFKTARSAPIAYVVVKVGTGLQDYENPVFQFLTVNSL